MGVVSGCSLGGDPGIDGPLPTAALGAQEDGVLRELAVGGVLVVGRWPGPWLRGPGPGRRYGGSLVEPGGEVRVRRRARDLDHVAFSGCVQKRRMNLIQPSAARRRSSRLGAPGSGSGMLRWCPLALGLWRGRSTRARSRGRDRGPLLGGIVRGWLSRSALRTATIRHAGFVPRCGCRGKPSSYTTGPRVSVLSIPPMVTATRLTGQPACVHPDKIGEEPDRFAPPPVRVVADEPEPPKRWWSFSRGFRPR